jgi:MFS family permease
VTVRVPHALLALLPLLRLLHRRRRGPSSRLRRSLRAATAEGLLAEVVGACAGATVLTGWALHLGASRVEVGLLGALPALASAVQLPAAWVTSAFGRRRTALVAVALSRQALLPLAALPFLPLAPGAARTVLFAVAGLSAVLGVVGNNAWVAWMAELVPAPIRGRYFGRRTAVTTLGAVAAALGSGRLLDAGKASAAEGPALALLALAACVVGAATTALMARQHEPAAPPPAAPDLAAALRPLRDPDGRRLLAYQVAWNAGVGIGGGYFAFHLLHNLGAGFTLLALHGAGVAALRVVAAPAWGRAIDRLGARPVLAACSFAIAAMPLLWLLPAPGMLWPIALDAAVGGVAWGGHGLATFAVPLAVAPRRDRPFYLAAFGMAGGVANAAAIAVGGGLAAILPARLEVLGHPAYGLHVLFVASALGRLAAAFLAMRIAEEGAGTLGELNRMVRGALRVALATVRVRVP